MDGEVKFLLSYISCLHLELTTQNATEDDDDQTDVIIMHATDDRTGNQLIVIL